jgi:integrase
LPEGISDEARRLVFNDLRPSSLVRYRNALGKFFKVYPRLSFANIVNYLATLSSTSSMEVFLSALSRKTGVSLFKNRIIHQMLLGKAQESRPSPFPRVINTIDFFRFVMSNTLISDNDKFIIQLALLTCARVADLVNLSSREVKIEREFISIARSGTKADRRHKGTALLIPITPSVFVPSAQVMSRIDFSLLWSVLNLHLHKCFPGSSLSPGIIRKSSACMLRRRGLSNQDIMEVGGWLSEQTLRRAYSRANVDWIFRYGLDPVSSFPSSRWPEMILCP